MKKILLYITVFATLLSLSACLKDDSKINYLGIEPIVINPLSNYPGRSFFPVAVVDSPFGTKKLNLTVNYSYGAPASQDINVVFKVNDSLSAAYNQARGKSYLSLPASAYSAGSLRVTIPKGANQAILPISVDPALISGGDNYIIAFTIVSADGFTVPANYRDIVYTLKGQ